jgi:hypothetical protein
LDPRKFDEFLDEYDLINEGVKMKDTEVKRVYTDPIRKLLKKAVEFFKFESGLKTAIAESFKPRNNHKLKKILE